MKIAVIGRGNVGGGLADLWERAGHELKRIGREGADVSDAEVVLVAVPGGAIADALDNVGGIEGKTVIDATNLVGVDPPEGFSSNAEDVKSRTNGPTATSFNANFASLYDRIGEAGSTPSSLWRGEEEARRPQHDEVRACRRDRKTVDRRNAARHAGSARVVEAKVARSQQGRRRLAHGARDGTP